MSTVAIFTTCRGVTTRTCVHPIAGPSTNRSRRPLSSSITKSQWNRNKNNPTSLATASSSSMIRRKNSHWAEMKGERLRQNYVSGKMAPCLGLASIVAAASVLHSQNQENEDVTQKGSSTPSKLMSGSANANNSNRGSDDIGIGTSQQTLALSPAFAPATTFAQEVGSIKGVFPQRYDVSVRALKGSRLSMEDEYYIANGGRFAAVFDGHGGGGVSTFLRQTLYDKVTKHMSIHEKEEQEKATNKENRTPNTTTTTSSSHGYISLNNIVNSIRAAFDEVENEVLQKDNLQYQGSTALAVWLHEDPHSEERTLLSANLGDSRAILSRDGKAIDVTRDHKPDEAGEKKRLLSMGEDIEWDEYSQVHRVRNLSLSRAIGDRFAKPAVSGEVEIQLIPISSRGAKTKGGDKFVVLASDGLWDVMTSQDCVDYIHKRLNDSPLLVRKMMSPLEVQRQTYTRRKNMSRYVANEALKRGSGDNVCVVIVWLDDLEDDL